jgi:hypothetical protein
MGPSVAPRFETNGCLIDKLGNQRAQYHSTEKQLIAYVKNRAPPMLSIVARLRFFALDAY